MKCLLHICQSVTRRKTGATAYKSSPSAPRAPSPHNLGRLDLGSSRSSDDMYGHVMKQQLNYYYQVCRLAREVVSRGDHDGRTRRIEVRGRGRLGGFPPLL